MGKKLLLKKPPMGWNSYDYYDTTVNEEQIKANADYMARNLKKFGWEYIVVDIEWYSYDAGTQRDRHQYIPFWKVEMDEYSRLMPCPDRFPSSAGGKGFGPLADYVHSLGLKFGIHIMRGIPRAAAHEHTTILGTDRTANEIANPYSICYWNPDMYGVNPDDEASQTYYNSLMELYASWGVDFIKCDDICRMDAASAKKEIEMLHKAIELCGRDIVLSLSPGPAKPELAEFYRDNSEMWRITDDFWDKWELLLNMFERCRNWQEHVMDGSYPDCDMLPLGYVGKGFGNERKTAFTEDEQITMMSLWCIFRSPLMIGAELTKLDEYSLKLLTNEKALHLLENSHGAREVFADEKTIVWMSDDNNGTDKYVAIFNISEKEMEVNINKLCQISGDGEEIWSGEPVKMDETIRISKHGAALVKITV